MSTVVNAGPCSSSGIHNEFHTSRLPELNLDNGAEQVTEKKRKRCCPYNFDGKLCRNVGNRILCGYNINIGSPNVDSEDINLNNGCRLKQGRLECGYDEPPYINFRRPPSWDNAVQPKISKEDGDIISKESTLLHKKLYLKTTIAPKPTTQCLEIRERIVCRSI
ncbi:jg6703 [Pararge aegeria aegeria]|uniref:Jg6703 protein n=1 Tax=Pararge aegeria aegeria TaxID=348720 RepID=A0A8S4SN81_9NEOP|nr:jg6703 [Pararge aegeria aegeria]